MRSLLVKFLISLSALSVGVRLHVPSYSLSLRVNTAALPAALRPDQEQPVAAAHPAVPSNTGKDAGARGASDAAEGTAGGSSGTAANLPGSGPGAGNGPGQAAVEFMNIAKEGTSVIAGRASPGAGVTVYDNGEVIGTAKAGSDGDWSLATEHKFSSADPWTGIRADAVAPSGGEAKVAAAVAEPAAAQRPAQRLIEKFEHTVEAARQEAKAASAAPAEPAERSSTDDKPIATAANTFPAATAKPESAPAPEIIPIPMQFVFREASLTDEGRRAVSLLEEYLKLKKFAQITLSGHADERGSVDLNMDLSRQRLETVKKLLREGGYTGEITLLPKGKAEPFAGVDRKRIPREDLMQLDRRVELRIAR